MNTYAVRKTGDEMEEMEEFYSYESAVEALKSYEAADRAEGTYEENCYEIVEKEEMIIVAGGKKILYKDYRAYMCDPCNIGKCETCPENRGKGDDRNHYNECGQQNCWVRQYCKDN